jgi:hypothetical protein
MDTAEILKYALPILGAYLGARVTFRGNRINAGNSALISLMKTHYNQKFFSEVDQKIHNEDEARQYLSFLNMVAKLYINGAITVNMLRTFEPRILSAFEEPHVAPMFARVMNEFRQNDAIGEPPYVTLIYVSGRLERANRILLPLKPGKRQWDYGKQKPIPFYSIHLYQLSLFSLWRGKYLFRYFQNPREMWLMCDKKNVESTFPSVQYADASSL